MLKNKKMLVPIMLVAFLLVISGVLLMSDQLLALVRDNNINEPACVKSKYNCDNNERSCNRVGLNWTTNGYQNAGNPNCCGDDSSELYKICKKHSNISWSCNDVKSCCSQALNNCISPDGSCVQGDGTAYHMHSISGVTNDKWAICNNTGQATDGGTWADPDDYTGTLKLYTPACGPFSNKTQVTRAGESSVGEYSDQTTNECCGDDKNEYYIIDQSDVYKRGYCCNNKTDMVVNGKCYARKNRVPAVR